MKFMLEIECDNEAFQEDLQGEVSRIIRFDVVPYVQRGDRERWVRDANGNKVGSWKIA